MTSSRVALVLSLLIVPAQAWASGPTAEDFATARTLYKEGKDLRAAGDLKGAFDKLKAAHALGHTPLTGIELARIEVALGMIVEAREVCLGIARMPIESDETERSAEARASAATVAEELKPRIASVRIHVSAGALAIVTVDNVTIPSVALDQPRALNPGHHVITAHVEGGATVSATVDVTEGKEGAVELTPPPALVTTSKPQPELHAEHRSKLGPVIVAGLVVTGLGLFLGATGGVYAIATTPDCGPAKQCLQTQWQSLDDARAAATLSTVGFSVAGAGVVLLVIGLLTHTSPKETGRARVLPHVGLGEIGVSGAF